VKLLNKLLEGLLMEEFQNDGIQSNLFKSICEEGMKNPKAINLKEIDFKTVNYVLKQKEENNVFKVRLNDIAKHLNEIDTNKVYELLLKLKMEFDVFESINSYFDSETAENILYVTLSNKFYLLLKKSEKEQLLKEARKRYGITV
jgi:hypothetical protein